MKRCSRRGRTLSKYGLVVVSMDDLPRKLLWRLHVSTCERTGDMIEADCAQGPLILPFWTTKPSRAAAELRQTKHVKQ